MALRSFTDREGTVWTVWAVKPAADAPPTERFPNGWLCFESADGITRCRLSLDETPEGWEELSDERLDLLRRVAVAASGPNEASPPA